MQFQIPVECAYRTDGLYGRTNIHTPDKGIPTCIKSRLHYQSFLVQENLVKVFDANFDSVNGQRKL